MAVGAIDVQVGASSLGQSRRLTVGGDDLRPTLVRRLVEQADVLQRPKLIGNNAVIIVILVQLLDLEPVDRPTACRVAEQTLTATGEVVGLLGLAARRRGVLDGERSVLSHIVGQHGIRLIVVPYVRVRAPRIFVPVQYLRLKPPPS